MKTKICQCCSKPFPTSIILSNKRRSLTKRIYCLECSPFGTKDRRHPQDRIKDQDGMRTCSSCKQRKPLNNDNFSKKLTEKSQYGWLCKPCASKRTILRQQVIKQKCLNYKGNKCEVCGYNKSTRALHFHHNNPQTKDFTLGQYRGRSWKATKAELDKCMLVCANCHAELHDQLIIKQS